MEHLLRKKLKDGKFTHVSQVRSKTMQAIRGKNNRTTDVRLRMALMRQGISGWKMHPKGIQGKPDLYFPFKKMAIFVDGCFWHGCPKCGHIPKTRSKFWQTKIERTQLRDKRASHLLKQQSVIVKRLWEHSLKTRDQLKKVVEEIKNI